MKINELPEKIILSADRETGTLYDEWSIEDTTDNIKIEYTRTDVFIEKAVEWLLENKDHPFIKCEDPCLSGYLTDEFIGEFKKAMEE